MRKTVTKQILRYGEWKNPNAKNGILSITKEYVKQLVENFKHTPFVPVLRGHVANNDAEANPGLIITKNIKELNADDSGLNAIFEVEDGELDKYNDVSASIDEAYENHETGSIIGATLKHIALVVDPYIKGLGNFIPLRDIVNYSINLSEIINMADTKSMMKMLSTMKTKEDMNKMTEEMNKSDMTPEEKKVMKKKMDEKAKLLNLSEITMAKKDKSKTELAEETVEVKEEVVETPTTTETVIEAEKVEEKPEEAVIVEPEVKAEEVILEVAPEVETKEETVDSADLQKTILDLQEQIKTRDVEIALGKAQSRFIELRDAGKATPAMEDSIKSLYQSSSTVVNLADGTKKSTGELLDQLFEKMPKLISFGEQGVNTEAIDEEAEPQKVQLMEIWKKQNPSWTTEQLEAKYKKSASLIKEVVSKS